MPRIADPTIRQDAESTIEEERVKEVRVKSESVKAERVKARGPFPASRSDCSSQKAGIRAYGDGLLG